MKRWSWHGTQALLLALLLGLGMSLSVFHDRLMAAEMAVMADDAHHRQGGCASCCGHHEGMDADTCLAVCGTAAQGPMPEQLLTLPPASRSDVQIARLHLSGQSHSPDHGPPKILTIG
jgi:hypothetical protein